MIILMVSIACYVIDIVSSEYEYDSYLLCIKTNKQTHKQVMFSKGGKMSKEGSDDGIGTTPLPRPSDGSSKAAKLFKPKSGKAYYYTTAKSNKEDAYYVTEDPTSFVSPTSVSFITFTHSFYVCNIVISVFISV